MLETYLDELGDQDDLVDVAPILRLSQTQYAVDEEETDEYRADDYEPLAQKLKPERQVKQVEVVVD